MAKNCELFNYWITVNSLSIELGYNEMTAYNEPFMTKFGYFERKYRSLGIR